MAEPTSIRAFISACYTGLVVTTSALIVKCLKKYGRSYYGPNSGLTQREIVDLINEDEGTRYNKDSFSPRFKRLKKANVIVELGERICKAPLSSKTTPAKTYALAISGLDEEYIPGSEEKEAAYRVRGGPKNMWHGELGCKKALEARDALRASGIHAEVDVFKYCKTLS